MSKDPGLRSPTSSNDRESPSWKSKPNLENPDLNSPRKSSKRQKQSSPMSKVPSLCSPTSSNDCKSPSLKSKTNLENPNLSSPSKSSERQKHSSPISKDPGLRSPTFSNDRESPSLKSKPNLENPNLTSPSKVPGLHSLISSNDHESLSLKSRPKRKEVSTSHLATSAIDDGSASQSSLLRWGEDDNLKLIKAVCDYRERNGCLPTLPHIPDFLKEVKDWAPVLISEKQLYNKLRHLRFKFQKSLKSGSQSSEFHRSFHEFASKVWGSGSSKANEKTEKIMESKMNTTKCDKKEVSTDVDGDLLEGTEAESPYKYLWHALEEFWTEKKLDMHTLNAAFPKVDPVQAKILDEQLKEIYVEEIELELEKNKLAVEIMNAALGR